MLNTLITPSPPRSGGDPAVFLAIAHLSSAPVETTASIITSRHGSSSTPTHDLARPARHQLTEPGPEGEHDARRPTRSALAPTTVSAPSTFPIPNR